MSKKRLQRDRRYKPLRRAVTVSGLLLVGTLLFYPLAAVALNTDDVKAMTALYEQYDMPRNNMISYIGRLLGWMLVEGLRTLVGMVEEAVWQISNLFKDFAASTGAQALIQRVALLGSLLFVFVLAYLGWQAMMDKVKWAEVFQNAVLSLVVLLILPTAMTKALTLTQQIMTYIKGSDTTSVTDQLVTNNVIDVTGYDTPGTFGSNGDVHPKGNVFGGDGISIVDLIDPDDMTDENAGVYNQYVDNGELKEVNKAEFFGVKIDIFSTQYYRYKVNWFPIFVSLVVSGVAFLFSGVKIARLLYELAINQALATFCAWLDIHSGQRLKKCLQTIAATFFTLCGVYLCFSFYIIGQAWIAKWPMMPQIIAMLAMAWALIDGPNLFEKIVGVDAGLQDGLRTMYGIRAATNMARAAGRGIIGTRMMDGSRVGGLINYGRSAARVAGNAASGAAEAGGRIAGNIAGRIQGQRPVHTSGGASGGTSAASRHTVSASAAGAQAAAAGTRQPDTSTAPVISGAASGAAAASGAVIAAPEQADAASNPPEDSRPVGEAAAASLDDAREAAAKEQEADTRRYNRTDETAAPVSMGEYIRNRAKNTGLTQTAGRIGSSAMKGYREGKDLRQGKAQRKADNARTSLGAEKIRMQNEHSAARYDRSQQRHQAINQRRNELQTNREHNKDVREATAAYRWLDKHDPVNIPAPPPDETIYRSDTRRE